MGHDEHYRLELFVFPDGTSVEMIVFAQAPAESPAASGQALERDACQSEREAQPQVKPTATHAPPPAAQKPGVVAHKCPLCSCDLVYPVDWERNSEATWNLELRCPNCETQRSVVLGREGIEAFNREIYRGSQAIAREADSMTRQNFAEESAKLVEALARDFILPMDF